MRPMMLAAIVFTVLFVAGCPDGEQPPDRILLYTLTVAPPTKVASLKNEDLDHSVTLSRGVALAVGSWTTCRAVGATPSLSVSDTAVAEVRPVFRSSGGAPTWAIVAKTAGTAQLKVWDPCSEQVYGLTVLDDQP